MCSSGSFLFLLEAKRELFVVLSLLKQSGKDDLLSQFLIVGIKWLEDSFQHFWSVFE